LCEGGVFGAEVGVQRVRHTSIELERRTRELRREATSAEQVLWEAVRAGRLDGLKFRRQHPIGRFVLDLYCAAHRLCIEVDGPVHEHQREHDAARDEELLAHGIRTLRFTNDQVLHDLPNVVATIKAAAGHEAR
jgi:very-short-patch-repair endonuclease